MLSLGIGDAKQSLGGIFAGFLRGEAFEARFSQQQKVRKLLDLESTHPHYTLVIV